MNKRLLSLVFLAIIIILLSVSFLLKHNAEPKLAQPNSSDTELSVYTFGPISEENYLKDALEVYKENNKNIVTDMRVVPLPPPQQQTGDFVAGYEYILLADFSAQNPPDIFTLNTGRIPSYMENGALLDLAPYLPEDYKKANNLSLDGPIYSLPFYNFVDLVAAFSTKDPQKTADLLLYISNDRINRDRRLANEAHQKALEAAKNGAGILDFQDDAVLFEIWNNLALSYSNNQILIDEDAKEDQDYLISHEQAFGYPYMTLRLSTNTQTGEPQVLLVFNDQYLENPTLSRNMQQAIVVLVRSIHKDIDETQTKNILTELGLIQDQNSLSPDLTKIEDKKTTTFGDYEFAALADPVSRAIRVTKLP